ncbi:baeRF12 domain-containing protein [Mesorhizobium xinjiangense]|uniref:baeRF12 domain-containing protein n=1 Tax=Mesorhizobium xinjiangense TaxID=2678685 RepID=UPI0012ED838C|nr:host attachment family protein [Mesorhizobium xinjiangense]
MSLLKLEHNLWVVVADGEKALFLRNAGTALNPQLEVVRQVSQENPPTHEQGTDRPGRLNDAAFAHRSAVADTDWHRIAKERFADEIADRLYKLAQNGSFDHFVLVAQPHVLGAIRKKMHKSVLCRIKTEVPKTLTNHTLAEIERNLLA